MVRDFEVQEGLSDLHSKQFHMFCNNHLKFEEQKQYLDSQENEVFLDQRDQ